MLSRRNTVNRWIVVAALCLTFPAAAVAQGQLAVVQGAPITEDEVNKAAAADLDRIEIQRLTTEAGLERNRYQARETALNRLVEERILALEAAKQKISPAELIAREVDSKVQDPSEAELDALYQANKARLNAPKEQLRPQMVQFLRQQRTTKLRSELIERLKPLYGVVVNLEPQRVEVASAGRPARGGAQAPVVLVEFSDFQCDYCRNFNPTLNRILSDYGDKVRLVYRHFPLTDIHALAFKAAEASMCAADQGKFWEMHDALFEAPTKLGPEDLKAKAAAVGLDGAAFGKCLDSGKHSAEVRQDLMEGARAGVSGTPALFVNGRLLTGVRPYPDVARTVEDELKRAARPAQAKPAGAVKK
jgi:protein-disulfide isomerase